MTLPLSSRRKPELRAFIDGWQHCDRRMPITGTYTHEWTDCPYAHTGLRVIFWQGCMARALNKFDDIELALECEKAL